MILESHMSSLLLAVHYVSGSTYIHVIFNHAKTLCSSPLFWEGRHTHSWQTEGNEWSEQDRVFKQIILLT